MHTVQFDLDERLLGPSKQDIVRKGIRKNKELWIVVADGHGTNKVTDTLRQQDWDTIMESNNHFEMIENTIRELDDTSGSGATLTTLIITNKGIHCRWRGDSLIKIFINNEEAFSSSPHNCTNASEHERMKHAEQNTQNFTITVLSPTQLTMDPSSYYVVGTKKNARGVEVPDCIAMTNALGHNEGSGGTMEYYFQPLKKQDNVTAIVATDGFWDMICPNDSVLTQASSASELVDVAVERWCQEWDYVYPNPIKYNGIQDSTTVKQTMDPSQTDDIGVCLWKGNIVE